MRNMKWVWIALFISGGLLIVALGYVLLRASGVLYKVIPNHDEKWVEYDS